MANAFKNDGSFMEQFLKKQVNTGPHQQHGFQNNSPPTSFQQPQQGFTPQPPLQFEQPNTNDFSNQFNYNSFPSNAPVLPQNNFFNPPFAPQNNFAPITPQNFGNFQRGPAGVNRNDQPSRSVWLGNIHPDTTEAEIRQEFSMFGMIESVKILPHKNCAFVNFMDLNDAINAHTHAFGKILRGNELRAGWGKVDNVVEDQRALSLRPEKFAPCKNLWVGNLSEGLSEEELRHEFEVYGRIERVRLLPQKNCAFVNFASVEEALAARNNLQGKMIYDRQIRINFGRDDEKMFPDTPSSSSSSSYSSSSLPPRGGPNSYSGDVPPFTLPPDDPELRERISNTVAMIIRRKLKISAFESYIKGKEKDNPKLQFMFHGVGSDYYRWKLYCQKYNLPENQPPPRSSSSSFPAQAGMSYEDRHEFFSILENLTGTKESIKSAKNWIADRSTYSHDIVDFLDKFINDSNLSPDKQLYIVYLINDVLYHCLKLRTDPSQLDSMSDALLDKMTSILGTVYPKATPDNQIKISKILNLWGEKSIFPKDILGNIERNIQNATGKYSPVPPPPEEELPPWLQNQQAPQHSSVAHPYFPPMPQFNPNQMAGEDLMASVNEFYNDVSVGNKRGRLSPDDGSNKRKY